MAAVLIDDDEVSVHFLWTVDDLRPLRDDLITLVRSPIHYAITVVSRSFAVALVFGITRVVLPEATLWQAFVIGVGGSYTLWVSWLGGRLALKRLDTLLAVAPHEAGVVSVTMDRAGVRWFDDISQTYTSWLGIAAVKDTKGAIWLKTGAASGFYLPARVFADRAERRRALEAIARLRAEPLAPTHTGQAPMPLLRH